MPIKKYTPEWAKYLDPKKIEEEKEKLSETDWGKSQPRDLQEEVECLQEENLKLRAKIEAYKEILDLLIKENL